MRMTRIRPGIKISFAMKGKVVKWRVERDLIKSEKETEG